ncbi:MAG: rhomboid family intramembrane serine protease [Bacteroidia bacterium]|nr:rhomboid family intramembrane serine protease [Bacteroidia bacterium]
MSILSRYHPVKDSEEQSAIEKRIAWYSFFITSAFVVVLWLIKLVEYEYTLDFAGWGIYPRELDGSWGILFSPLIHGSFAHLAANTVPMFVLMFSLFFFYRKSSALIFVLIYFSTGLFVWLGGREAWHIGASGLIYGLAAFLFLSGVLSSNVRLLTISLVVAFFYGGLFWGIFPIKPEISWESHLWGALSGFALAVLFRKSAPAKPEEQEEEDDVVEGEWMAEEVEEEEKIQ